MLSVFVNIVNKTYLYCCVFLYFLFDILIFLSLYYTIIIQIYLYILYSLEGINMKKTFSDTYVWRDISDPRRAQTVDDLEAGLKSPDFENLSIPETFGPVKEIIDDHKIK